MSIETFTHQTEKIVLPDDIEANMRAALTEHAHLNTFDLNQSLHNPADALMRMADILVYRFLDSNDLLLRQHRNMSFQKKDFGNERIHFTIGDSAKDTLEVVSNRHIFSPHSVSIPHNYELAMLTDSLQTMYLEDSVAIVRIDDDIARASVVSYAGSNNANGMRIYKEMTDLPIDTVREIYAQAFNRLSRAVNESYHLPQLSPYIVREIGKRATE